MTVKNLIAALSKLPEDLEVMQMSDTDYTTLDGTETVQTAWVAKSFGRWYEVTELRAKKLKTAKKIVIVAW